MPASPCAQENIWVVMGKKLELGVLGKVERSGAFEYGIISAYVAKKNLQLCKEGKTTVACQYLC